jgi:chromosome segregation ATPase
MQMDLALILIPVFLIAALFFIIRFYLQSQKVLEEIKKANGIKTVKQKGEKISLSSISGKARKFALNFRKEKSSASEQKGDSVKASDPVRKAEASKNTGIYSADSLITFRKMIHEQQFALSEALQKIEEVEQSRNTEYADERDELIEKIDSLKWKLEQKENEIIQLNKQEALAQKLTSRLDEVAKEFDGLQSKISHLERQAGRAHSLTIQLEEAQGLNNQLRTDLSKKQHALDDTMEENNRLRNLLNETEDKLSEANMQRQTLYKKIQLLEGMNDDFQKVNETNSKLQTELRRIGELESMLHMIAEERDHLLKRKSSNK